MGISKNYLHGPKHDQTKQGSPLCGALIKTVRRTKTHQTCKHYAGFRTNHPGEGRCYLHGGRTPNTAGGRYSRITHRRIRHLLDELAQTELDAMNLEPEAQLLRAMIIDFVNRYDTFIEQLDAWYQIRDDERARLQMPPTTKRIPELGELKELAEGVSRVVERMHRIQREGSITLDTFRYALQQMGLAVAKYVADPKVLQRIEKDWGTIVIDNRVPTTPEPPVHDSRDDGPSDQS